MVDLCKGRGALELARKIIALKFYGVLKASDRELSTLCDLPGPRNLALKVFCKRPLPIAALRAQGVFSDHRLEHVIVQAQLRNQLFQPGILVAQVLDLLGLAHFHAPYFAFQGDLPLLVSSIRPSPLPGKASLEIVRKSPCGSAGRIVIAPSLSGYDG